MPRYLHEVQPSSALRDGFCVESKKERRKEGMERDSERLRVSQSGGLVSDKQAWIFPRAKLSRNFVSLSLQPPWASPSNSKPLSLTLSIPLSLPWTRLFSLDVNRKGRRALEDVSLKVDRAVGGELCEVKFENEVGED